MFFNSASIQLHLTIVHLTTRKALKPKRRISMKLNIKASIAIVTIALTSITMAQAGENRHQREGLRFDDNAHKKTAKRPNREHQYRQKSHRYSSKHSNRHYNYRAKRRDARQQRSHERRQYRYERGLKRVHNRHYGWKKGWKRQQRKHYKRDHYRRSRYVEPHYNYIAPRRASHNVVVSSNHHSDNVLPVLAGGLIGSAIASDVSDGDPGAAFGGAIMGAIIGNAIAQH